MAMAAKFEFVQLWIFPSWKVSHSQPPPPPLTFE